MRHIRLLMALLVVALASITNSVLAECYDDDVCGAFNGTSYFACCSGLSLKAYCIQKFSENAVFVDGQCDRYRTGSPTKEPTRHPTRAPTRFFFPTQSPQTLEEFNSFFKPTAQPTGVDGRPVPVPNSTTSSGGGSSIGLAVGIVAIAVVFGGVFMTRRRMKRSKAMMNDTEFGAGSTARMTGRHPTLAHGGEDDLALT